ELVWLTPDQRYTEKLATPDISVADLIGEVDPIKVAEGRYLSDELTIHYGLVPRTHRGIFALNELPDLAERVQVSLLNVMEARAAHGRDYGRAAHQRSPGRDRLDRRQDRARVGRRRDGGARHRAPRAACRAQRLQPHVLARRVRLAARSLPARRDDARVVDARVRRVREAGAADPRDEGRRRETRRDRQPRDRGCGGRVRPRGTPPH